MPRIGRDSVATATEILLKKIENYEIKSGDAVSDAEIAKELGVSRTPVREAMMLLVDNGVLERKRSKFIVSPIYLDDIIEIIEVREAIEVKVLEIILNKDRVSLEFLENISELQKKMRENIMVGNLENIFQCDHEFHQILFEAAGNKRFLDINHRINLQTQRTRWLTQLTPERFMETYNEHEQILAALKKKEIAQVKDAMLLHLKKTKENYASIFSNEKIFNMVTSLYNEM